MGRLCEVSSGLPEAGALALAATTYDCSRPVAIRRADLLSEVSRYAYEGPLTRLANRRGFDQCLRQWDQGDGDATLLLCDLEGLKQINDRDGHPAGDRMLRGVVGAMWPLNFGRQWSPPQLTKRRSSRARRAAGSPVSWAPMSVCAEVWPRAIPTPAPHMN